MTTNTITAYAVPEADTMTANAEPQAEPKKAGPKKAAQKKAEPKADVKKANVFCLQENLAKGLSIVGRAAVSRATLPVLSNVLIAADGARLKLSATNLEVAITCWIGAQIENGEFAITVPAKTFSETITTMPKGGVEMTLDAGTQTLTVRGDHVRIIGVVAGIVRKFGFAEKAAPAAADTRAACTPSPAPKPRRPAPSRSSAGWTWSGRPPSRRNFMPQTPPMSSSPRPRPSPSTARVTPGRP